jgi:hypothetical protein
VMPHRPPAAPVLRALTPHAAHHIEAVIAAAPDAGAVQGVAAAHDDVLRRPARRARRGAPSLTTARTTHHIKRRGGPTPPSPPLPSAALQLFLWWASPFLVGASRRPHLGLERGCSNTSPLRRPPPSPLAPRPLASSRRPSAHTTGVYLSPVSAQPRRLFRDCRRCGRPPPPGPRGLITVLIRRVVWVLRHGYAKWQRQGLGVAPTLGRLRRT